MSTKNVLYNFETIDNEEKAYWLGFLYADGSVGSNESKIELGLAEKDLHQIEKFRDFIGLSNKISYRANTKSYRFSFRCDNMKQDLINKGCVPNKSLILKFPTYKQVPKNLMRHFIRGYFDGDGSLHYLKGTDNYRISFTCGSAPFLEDIKKELLVTNISLGHSSDTNTYQLQINGRKQVERILTYLYNNSTQATRLDRKYSTYLKCLDWAHRH